MSMAEKSTTRNGTAREHPRRSASFFLGICACVVSGPILQSCASPPPDERLHSTLWVQTSAEYGVTTGQVYQMATERLDAALRARDVGNDVPEIYPFLFKSP